MQLSFELPVPDKNYTMQFYWAPFPKDIIEGLHELREDEEQPLFLVLSFCLWHVLHEHDVSAFASEIAELDKAARVRGRW